MPRTGACSTRTTTFRWSGIATHASRGGRPPDAHTQYSRALSVRTAGRAGRATARDYAGRRRTRHRMLSTRAAKPTTLRGASRAASPAATARLSHTLPITASLRNLPSLSPEEWPSGYVPSHVARIPLSGATTTSQPAWGPALAATFLDAGTDEPRHPASLARSRARLSRAPRVRREVSFVADEVQVGHGRSWRAPVGVRSLGIEPDFVTVGKPMGNGYPVAAVITRRDLIERFAFAGVCSAPLEAHPVAARAALAVLDAIQDERPGEPTVNVSGSCCARESSPSATDAIRDVRGSPACSSASSSTSRTCARAAVEAMRRDGVLVGRTGPRDDTLKIRPPLGIR